MILIRLRRWYATQYSFPFFALFRCTCVFFLILIQVHQAIWTDSVSGAFRHEAISVEAAQQRGNAAPKANAIPLQFLCITALLADDEAARPEIACSVCFKFTYVRANPF